MKAYATAVAALLATACSSGGSSSPTSPSASDAGGSRLALILPVRPGDSANVAYGIWPFGVHGSGHAADGHPGYDFEYKPGSSVLAAADGTIDNAIVETSSVPGEVRMNVQLRVPGPAGDYFISNSNLVGVPPSLTRGARVTQGQVIGTAGTVADGGERTFAMSHFQVADPSDRTPALSNNGAVNPEGYFTSAARAELDAIWRTAAYINEWCEPFLGNVRANGFPMRRTWTRQSGDGPLTIEVRCPIDSPDAFEYSLSAAGGGVTETGRLRLGWNLRPTTADFIPTSGPSRLGLYDIISGTMQLSLAPAGASRPASFAGASTYTTQ